VDSYIPKQACNLKQGSILQPGEVLSSRVLLRGHLRIPQVLIHWQNTSQEDATWENVNDMEEAFPSFNLEDKVNSKGEGIVKNTKGREVLKKPKKGKKVNVELVKERGHVEDDAYSKNLRRSDRNRMINKRLAGYEL